MKQQVPLSHENPDMMYKDLVKFGIMNICVKYGSYLSLMNRVEEIEDVR